MPDLAREPDCNPALMSIPYPAGEGLTCQQIRDLDVLAIEHVGIPGIVLMENAGAPRGRIRLWDAGQSEV